MLVVFLHEALVVYEEDVGGDGDGGVAIVYDGCGVEELDALAELFVHARWLELEGVLEEAVECSCGDGFFGCFTDLGELAEDLADVLAFFC